MAVNTNEPVQWDDMRSEEFEFLEHIGKGGFGSVYSVIRKDDSSKTYALKVIQKVDGEHHVEMNEAPINECRACRAVMGLPFIIQMCAAFQSKFRFYILFEYLPNGSLASHLVRYKKFNEVETRFLVAELILGIEILHKKKIVHRDLKLDNVLVNNEGHIRIADLGGAIFLNKSNRYRCFQNFGTIEYMAPEVIEVHQQKGYNQRVDWWSLGATMFKLLAGHTPFAPRFKQKNSETIKRRIVTETPKFPPSFSPDVKDFIGKLLTKDPNARLGKRGALALKKHAFFKQIDWVKLSLQQPQPGCAPFLIYSAPAGNLKAKRVLRTTGKQVVTKKRKEQCAN